MHDFRFAMRALALAIFAGAASMRILDPLLPDIATTYGESVGSAAMVVSAYAISYSCCQLFYGPLGDKLGAYRVVTGATLVSTFAALSCALATSLPWLVTMRFISGAVAAAVGPLTLAWVGSLSTDAQRPVAVARLTGASILGTTLGQVGGGLIGQYAGWRSAFGMVGSLFGVASAVLLFLIWRQPYLKDSGKNDVAGGGDDTPQLLDLFRSPRVQGVLIAVLIEGIAMFMSFTYIAVLLQKHLKLNTGNSGLLIALFAVGGLIFVTLAGKIMPRLREGQRAAVGATLAATSLALLPVVGTAMTAGVCLFGLGLGFFMVHNVLQVRATQMEPRSRSAATSLFASSFFLAQAIGASIGGFLIDRVGLLIPFEISAAILISLGYCLFYRDRRQLLPM